MAHSHIQIGRSLQLLALLDLVLRQCRLLPVLQHCEGLVAGCGVAGVALREDELEIEVDAAVFGDGFFVVLPLKQQIAILLQLKCLQHVLLILRLLILLARHLWRHLSILFRLLLLLLHLYRFLQQLLLHLFIHWRLLGRCIQIHLIHLLFNILSFWSTIHLCFSERYLIKIIKKPI